MDSTDGQKRPPQPHCQPQGILWGLLTCFSLPSQDSIWKKPVEVVPHAPMGQTTPVIQTPSLLAYLARLANQVQNLWSLCLQLGCWVMRWDLKGTRSQKPDFQPS